METFPKFIVIWKDLTTGKIVRTRIENRSEVYVKVVYGSAGFDAKLLFLFRVKTIRYGSMSVSKLQK